MMPYTSEENSDYASDSYEFSLGSSNIIFHAPHGSLNIPVSEKNNFTIDEKGIANEHLHMADKFTDSMAYELAEKSNSSYFINRVSRLVCDPERFIGDGEEMESVGMGFAYTHGFDKKIIRNLSPIDKEEILEKYYHPYASKFTNLVNQKLHVNDSVCILDIHSYSSQVLPYELHGDGERPEICIGFDAYHASDEMIQRAIAVLSEKYEVGINSPFSGSYIPLEHYLKDNRVSSLMIEIRRDTYMDENSGELVQDKYDSLINTLNLLQTEILLLA